MRATDKYLIPLFQPIWSDCGRTPQVRKMYLGEYYNTNQWQLSCSEKVDVLGKNTGNCLFIESVVQELGLENCTFFFELTDRSKEFVEEHFSAMVIPCSNFISPARSGALDFFASLAEKYDLPVILIGIGNQLTAEEKPHPSVIESLKNFAERCTSIGVRGEMTADILGKYGIKNVDVIGCPSVFSSLDPNFRVIKNNEPDWKKPLAFNTELNRDGIDFLLKMRRFSPAVRFYMQNETNFWYEPHPIHHLAAPVLSLKNIQERHPNITLQQFREMRAFISRTRLMFFNSADWQQSLRECVMSLGMRFHGNMMALLAGIPAVWVTHDNRTRELINFLRLPTFMMSGDIDVRKIYDEADYSEFNAAYPALYRNYRDFLSKNGINSTKLG